MRAAGVLLTQAAAFWPVWVWYVARLQDGSDEPGGFIALSTALYIVARHGRPGPVGARTLAAVTAVGALYLAAVSAAPTLICAALAAVALGISLGSWRLGRDLHLGLIGLLMLSLPIIASLQFFLGYPFRVVTAHLAALLLSAAGCPVTAAGVALTWRGEAVILDVPCTGARMLWVGMYVHFLLSCLSRLGLPATWLGTSLVSVIIFAGNVLRTILLFLLETRQLPISVAWHGTVGLACFGVVALAIRRLHRGLGASAPAGAAMPVSRPVAAPAWLTGAFLAVHVAAALVPLAVGRDQGCGASHPFPGWPARFEGRAISRLPLTSLEKRYEHEFPGRVARFTDGSREILLRWLDRPTRSLHPSSNCLRGEGYGIEPQPLWRAPGGRLWGAVLARRSDRTLAVRECIVDPDGRTFADVSAWYWAAVLGQSRGPWWAMVVARREAAGS